MKKALGAPIIALLVLHAVVLLPACGDDDVGVPCSMTVAPPDPGAGGTQSPQVNTAALDCRSRLCLAVGDPADERVKPLCTKICESDDDCPESGPGCPENARFVCRIALETGAAVKCCKMCICNYFLPASAPKVSAECAKITPNCPEL